MFRTSDIVLIGIMVSAAAATYAIKRDAEDQLSAVRKIEQQIRFEEDTIALLKADWSLLTQPARLQRLVERHQDELGLQPMDAHQYVRIEELPQRPLEIRDILTQSDLIAEGEDTDMTSTGAVE